MKISWTCPNCSRKEITSPSVVRVAHLHGKDELDLIPYKKPRKLPGEITLKSLKVEVWDIFSEYIRRSNSDDNGYCTCITCGKISKWNDGMQAGHYISRIHSGTFIDERTVHCQCSYCNGPLKGNLIEYHAFMLKQYGQKVIDQLEYLSRRRHNFNVYELTQYKTLYLNKLEGIK